MTASINVPLRSLRPSFIFVSEYIKTRAMVCILEATVIFPGHLRRNIIDEIQNNGNRGPH